RGPCRECERKRDEQAHGMHLTRRLTSQRSSARKARPAGGTRVAEKIDRKQLKRPDEFQVVAGRAMSWMVANRGPVLGAAGAVIAIVLIAWGVTAWRSSREGKAGGELAEALELQSRPISGRAASDPGQQPFASKASRMRASSSRGWRRITRRKRTWSARRTNGWSWLRFRRLPRRHRRRSRKGRSRSDPARPVGLLLDPSRAFCASVESRRGARSSLLRRRDAAHRAPGEVAVLAGGNRHPGSRQRAD